MIEASDATPKLLSYLLNDAAIDHRSESENQIYVIGLPFNFWLELDEDRCCLIFSTYWDFRNEVSEVEALRGVNALNLELMMIQFSADQNLTKLQGHFLLPIRDGLDRKQFLRAARMFADIFDAAVRDEKYKHLLEPHPSKSSKSKTLTAQPYLIN